MLRHRGLLLIAFPTLLLMLVAAERSSTYLLGIYPSEPTMWQIWLELRPQMRLISDQLDVVTGYSLSLQALLLLLAGTAVVFALKLRKSAVVLFLANHLALLATAIGTVLAAGARVAGPGLAYSSIDNSAVIAGLPFTWLQFAVLIAGTGCCAFCHYVYLAEARHRSSALSVRIAELQRNF
ncbi:hypothetical protein ACG873_01800 (plasmid) [Mesorhizobium sp. AaZ16]|uniref:hypothetical protein n=1 Tax=Mesorhizobium sp. AaZ16 TaxID=3402289 RepID=UPI00374ED6B4